MMKDKIEKIKDLVVKKDGGDNKKTIENLVVFVIILIVTIIAINAIWNKDSKKSKSQEESSYPKQLAEVGMNTNNNLESTNTQSSTEIEEKLKNILSKIQGVGKVDVFITYYQTSQVVPLYNLDLQENSTEENDKEGGTRKINETSTKKDVIYGENNGEKVPITQSIVSPKIEGAIITAQGADDATVKANIVSAVEAVTGVGSHKIQVFEMQD